MTASFEAQESTGKGGNRPARAPAAQLIDIHCVAEVLGVTPRHIQRLVAERRIPYLKIGRFVRFDGGELSVWLDQQRIEPHDVVCRVKRSDIIGGSKPGGPDDLELVECSESVHLTQIPPRRGTSEQ